MRIRLAALIHRHQPVRLRIGQRLQQRRIHKRKQRHAGRDPQRQDQDRRHREARILRQLPECKAQILQQVFHQRQRVALAIRLPRPLHAAQLQDRHAPRLLTASCPRARSPPSASGCGSRSRPPSPARARNPRATPRIRCHHALSCLHAGSSPGLQNRRKNRATIAVACSHSRASCSSRFRPARVSL